MQDDNVEVPDLLEQLQDISMKDGYKIAFVMLYGPCFMAHALLPHLVLLMVHMDAKWSS